MKVNVDVEINNDDFQKMLAHEVAEEALRDWEFFASVKDAIKEGTKECIYSHKDEIVNKVISLATAEIQRKAMPKLVETMMNEKLYDIADSPSAHTPTTITDEPNAVSDTLADDDLVADMDLSVRAINCLRRAGIVTIGQLKALDFQSLYHVRNLGTKATREVVTALFNLDGTVLEGYDPSIIAK